MNGEETIVRALMASADAFFAVPGYPVTGVAEALDAELTVNEKVAMEYALGESLSGRRAAVILKNVGLNVCADPMVNATTQGLRAGVVVLAGDDIGIIASQNAQDSRYYGEIAQIPVIEPDLATIGRSVEYAYQASESFSRVAMIRLTPPVLSGEADPEIAERVQGEGRIISRSHTMKGRVTAADRLFGEMFAWSRNSPLNRFGKGVVAAGGAAGFSRAVTVYPPPAPPGMLEATSELGRPFLREHRHAEAPAVQGEPETFPSRGYYRTLCRNCPYGGLFRIMKERGMNAVCDIGCSLLAMNPPYSIGIASYGLGSSPGVAARSTGIALCGDYAFLHSGLNALIDVYEKKIPLLCIVLKNNRMAMTGGHPSPDILRYVGWADPLVIDAHDTGSLEEAVVKPREPSLLVVQGQCPEGEEHETVEC